MVIKFFNQDRILKPSEEVGKYKIIKIFGEGRFGICYQVSKGTDFYILKQLKSAMLKKVGIKVCFEEEILRMLEHEAIPRFVEKIEIEDFYGYLLSFKKGRTFEDIICFEEHVFSREEIFSIGDQLIQIIKYLHSMDIVHRDIRIPNTLYAGSKVNLIDFGLARWMNNKRYRADIDFAFLGDFLLHLYYTSFELKGTKKCPWYQQLKLTEKEMFFLKRLMGIEKRFENIIEAEEEFYRTYNSILISPCTDKPFIL